MGSVLQGGHCTACVYCTMCTVQTLHSILYTRFTSTVNTADSKWHTTHCTWHTNYWHTGSALRLTPDCVISGFLRRQPGGGVLVSSWRGFLPSPENQYDCQFREFLGIHNISYPLRQGKESKFIFVGCWRRL